MFSNVFANITGGPKWDWDMFTRNSVHPKQPGYVDIFSNIPDSNESNATELWLLIMTDDNRYWVTYKKPLNGLILPTKKFEAKYFNFRDGATRSRAMSFMVWEVMEWLGFGSMVENVNYRIHYEEMCTIRYYHTNAVVLAVTVSSLFMEKTRLPVQAIPLHKIVHYLDDNEPYILKRQEDLLRKVLLNIKM